MSFTPLRSVKATGALGVRGAGSVSSFSKTWPNFKESAYAVVFLSLVRRATKVFIKRDYAPREHVEKAFDSEVRAYEIAQNDQSLCSLVPQFFGHVAVESVKDAKGNDISSQFHFDLAYEMEKIEGDFVKIGSLPSENTQAVCKLFRSAGVGHICDASVIEHCGNIEKVIDFATEEHVLEY